MRGGWTEYAAIAVTALCLGLGPVALPAAAQDAAPTQPDTGEKPQPAILVADQVFITPDRQLVAEGNVEAFQGDMRLRARKITFDRETGILTVEGPIRIDQGGTMTVLAESAEMDKDLREGLLSGARMVLDQQLQLAALQMTRVGGRYTQLYKTAVTSCHVCEDGKPPLWQIRARKITHDQLERQLYFEDAQFRILGVPVFYFPGLRLPDPTLDRATGFLIPSVRTTTQLSTGIKVPYFIKMGDHKDLTLSPYVSSRTRTLDFRYRQAFRRGRLQIDGAHTRDDLIPGEDRGFLNAVGNFDLMEDFMLDFDIRSVSDDAYLVDYGLPNLDRLRSEVALARIKRDSLARVGLINYTTLRDGEDENTLPTRIADAHFQQRLHPAAIGGEIRLSALAHGHERTSDQDVLGRDVVRATIDADWRRSWTFAGGLRADWQMGLAADTFNISHDSNYPGRADRLTPRAAMTLRYPVTRTMTTGARHFIEPIAQLGWTNVNGDPTPNDESNFVEFDRGNLLSLSRFPAADRREDGPTFVYGLNWARFDPAGWEASATVGQVFRKTADPNFSQTSGLAGTSSDILLAGQLKLKQGLSLTARSLLEGSFRFSKAELRGDWRDERTNVSGTYLWLDTDPAEGRPQPVSELWFDGSYEVSDRWIASANLRYDIEGNRATSAGVGVIYRNECVTVDVSVNRRYTSSASVEPSTDFGFTISLNGFSVDSGKQQYRRSCS